MLIKKTDDKTKDIETLRSLLNHPAASAETKKRIETEIRNMPQASKASRMQPTKSTFTTANRKIGQSFMTCG